jgi:hypothetical protein
MPLPRADIMNAIGGGGNKFNPTPAAQRFPTNEQLDARVRTGQMDRDVAISESDRIQAELLRRAIRGK